MELDDSLDIPWSALKPTTQAILWLSDLVARYQLRPDVVPSNNPKLHKAMATLELKEMDSQLQKGQTRTHGIDRDSDVHAWLTSF